MALRARLRGLDRPADVLVFLLDQVRASHLRVSESLKTQVQAAVEQATAEANRRYALKVAVSCLEELGHRVESGFETKTAAGLPVQLRRARWPGHAIQLRFSTSDDSIELDVVRAAGARHSSRTRDREVQEEFCDDYARLSLAAQGQGVELSTIRATPPGAPIQTGTPDRPPRPQKKSL